MPTYKTKSKFVTFENVGLRLTNKEFMKAEERFKEYEKRIDSKFKKMRSMEQKKKLPKYNCIP